jgi:primosomal protein N' (replication factor Y)
VPDSPILKVAVNVPLSRQFDYLPPVTGPCPVAGVRVQVPFGRRRQVGVVLGQTATSDFARDKIRHCDVAIDESPLLSEDDLWLIRFTSDYYHHPIGEVVAAALPALLRQGRSLLPTQTFYCVTAAGEQSDIDTMAKRAPRQAELLTLLTDAGGGGIDTDALGELFPTWRQAAKGLLSKGLIAHFDAQAESPEAPPDREGQAGPSLNEDQLAALKTVRKHDGFAAYLLDGVTGSGKTEVYLQLMLDALTRGEQILVLVPEIGLTPQLVGRLHERLGILPALMHSGLSDLERLRAWRDARSGRARLVVGTRSAIFTPLPKLGLIVVDEEHDHSFKQQEGLRYSARDLAITRAKHRDIPVVLGSATPTLEMLQHCRNGNFQHIKLPQRAGGATPPRVSLVDLTRSPSNDGLSDALTIAIKKHLDASGQVLLFLNRRGFAPTLICASCGHIAECERCDSRMTVHAREQQLRCHHCGAKRSLDTQCSSCSSVVRPLGEGTERLEEALRRHFPEHRIQRIDSDSTQRKGSMVEALALATGGDADILVGTQMLSKGHHFPKLTLVGVVNADQGLFGTDFRSGERLAQSIIQVAGRSGREARQGEVLIQTAFPDHPFWQCLLQGGYTQVAEDALAEREASRWPPFTRLALIRANAHRLADAHAFLESTRQLIESHEVDRLRVLGPVDAPMARRAGRYRAQLLLQSGNRQALHAILRDIRPGLENSPLARKVRWSIDVDPIELF